MDSFTGSDRIILQPGSDAVPYTFTFSVASSATANDGSIPYGTTISSVAVKAFDEGGTDRTTEIVDSSSVSSPTVSVALNYPSTTGAGRYSLEIVCTLSSTAVMEFDFLRVFAEDIAA